MKDVLISIGLGFLVFLVVLLFSSLFVTDETHEFSLVIVLVISIFAGVATGFTSYKEL